MRDILDRLPMRFRGQVGERELEGLEELRLRAGRPLELYYGCPRTGKVIQGAMQRERPCGRTRFLGRVEQGDIREMLNYLTGYSLYAYEEEIRKGFFTIAGGHRVGLVGHASMERTATGGESISDLPEIAGINLRIARQVRGCGLPLMDSIRKENGIRHTIILAPPGAGKTTLLRDVIRILSDGADGGRPFKVGVVDERSEIAACRQGIPQNDVGRRTDVLDNCPKSLGMEMLVRTMSPEIVAVDELAASDIPAVEQVLNCGCGLLATVHGSSLEELRKKPGLERLFREGWITRVILLAGDGSFAVC